MTEGRRRQNKKYRRRHPERIAAKKAVSKAIEDGDLVRPVRCSMCGSFRFTEGHHPNYSHPLYVLWLCRPCHDDVHVEINRQKGVITQNL